MVAKCREGHCRQQSRGHLSAKAAAAGTLDASRFGLLANLSVPCVAGADAAAPDRHGAIQIRRIQAERVDQGCPQSGLLETGPALSRRRRVHDRDEPLDRRPGLHRRAIRPDLAVEHYAGADARHQKSVTTSKLRDASQQRHQQSAAESRQAALRQRGTAQGYDVDDRPQGVRRHSDRRGGQDRCGDAAAAGRAMGDAARDAATSSRLRS